MGKQTSIAWTDHTFNPWWGCTKVSPGCDHCYAERFDKRVGGGHWGKNHARRTFGEKHWTEPEAWNAAAEKAGTTARVFTASMADVMDDDGPKAERQRLWALIDRTPALTWLLLTKRPHRYERYLPVHGFKHGNVMLGCTAENSAYYAHRFHYVAAAARRLQQAGGSPARVRTFVSYEPALGPLDLIDAYATLRSEREEPDFGAPMLPDQVIFGGETGPDFRAPELKWARNLRDQCERFRVAFFMKQYSALRPSEAAKLIPADLLIRQPPTHFEA